MSSDNQQPYFDFELQRNITVTIGQTGFFHCRVEKLGDKDVSKMGKYKFPHRELMCLLYNVRTHIIHTYQ